jgi:hypothetical protein
MEGKGVTYENHPGIYLAGGTGGNHEKSQSGFLVS